MKVAVEGPAEFQGGIVGVLMQRRGIIIGTTEAEGFSRVEAEVPLAEMFGFSTVLRSATQGKAEFTMEFSRYCRCRRRSATSSSRSTGPRKRRRRSSPIIASRSSDEPLQPSGRGGFSFAARAGPLHSRAMAKHSWTFFRAGGVDQVILQSGDDLKNLDQLDQKLWVALSCPVKGLEIDQRTLELLDADKDGARPPAGDARPR
jgi:hypothetical protein